MHDIVVKRLKDLFERICFILLPSFSRKLIIQLDMLYRVNELSLLTRTMNIHKIFVLLHYNDSDHTGKSLYIYI